MIVQVQETTRNNRNQYWAILQLLLLKSSSDCYQKFIGVNQTTRKKCSFTKRNLKSCDKGEHINRLDIQQAYNISINKNLPWYHDGAGPEAAEQG